MNLEFISPLILILGLNSKISLAKYLSIENERVKEPKPRGNLNAHMTYIFMNLDHQINEAY